MVRWPATYQMHTVALLVLILFDIAMQIRSQSANKVPITAAVIGSSWLY